MTPRYGADPADIRAPFDLSGRPRPDVHFDLDRHIRASVAVPVRADQFDVLISEFLSRPLGVPATVAARDRPRVSRTGGSPRRSSASRVGPMACPGPKPSPVSSTFRPRYAHRPQSDDASSEPVASNSMSFVLEGLRRLRAEPAARRERRDVVADPSVRRRTHGRARGAVAGSKANGRQPALDLEARRTSFNGRAGVEKVLSPYAHSPRRREARREVSRGLGH